MPPLSRTFEMPIAVGEAQERFTRELESAFLGYGFRLREVTDGHLVFTVGGRRDPSLVAGFAASPLLMSVAGAGIRGGRSLAGRRIEVDFTPLQDGCRVEVYGRAGGRVRDAVLALGRNGHWPTNVDDPLWQPPLDTKPDLSEWDDEDIDPSELDRITRRALKKSGRLNSS
jgi:hypothetical protein